MYGSNTDKTYKLTVSFAAASYIWNKRKQRAMLLFSTDKFVNQTVDYSYMDIL